MPGIYELFSLVLEDENIFSARRQCLDEKKAVHIEISQHEELISKARRHLLTGKIDFEDFRCIKKEYNQNIYNLNGRLQHLVQKLNGYDSSNEGVWSDSEINVFQSYNTQDIVGKRHIASLFTPLSINTSKRDLNPLQIDQALKKIVRYNALIAGVTQTNF